MGGPPAPPTPGGDVMTTVDEATQQSAPSPETLLLQELSKALDQLAAGDLRIRLNRRDGLPGEVVERFNRLVEMKLRHTLDLLRISRVVGREGRMTERLDQEGFQGAWLDRIH